MTGSLCEAAYSPRLAALALLDSVIVRPSAITMAFEGFSHVDQLLFRPGESVALHGLTPRAQVIVDGNPFLREGLPVELEYLPDLVSVARIGRAMDGGRDVR